MNKRQVKFAPTCKVVVVVDRTTGIEDDLWYTSDDCDQFKLASHLFAQEVREQILQGSFAGEHGDILGLEKLLCGKTYSARRAVLKAAVFEEQAWQRLSRQMRMRRGLDDVDIDVRVMSLAHIAQENSRWAREHASVGGLALQSDLYVVAEDGDETRLIHQGPCYGDDEESCYTTNKRPYAEAEDSFEAGDCTCNESVLSRKMSSQMRMSRHVEE